MKTELMKRIRRIAVIAVVVMSLLLLTACGGKSEKNAFAAFAGEWAADVSSYNGIVIHEDGSWELYKNGGLYSTGELDYHSEDDSVWISPDNNTQWSRLSIEEDGSLYAAPIGYFLLGEISLDYTPEAEEEWNENTSDDWYGSDMGSVDISEYVGLWEYVGENLWLCIYDDATWSFFNDQEDVIASGTLTADEFGVTLCFDGSGDEMRLDVAVSGDLLDGENNGTLVPADKIESRMPYFTRNGLEINAAVDAGTYWIEDGVCSYVNLGDGYSTGDCYWEVTKNYDSTRNGIREIQFDAVCYVPQSSLGTFYKEFIFSSSSNLYDFYTGKWFTTASTYGTSTRGENYYLHTIDWNGQSEAIEFVYSTEWQSNVGDWAYVLTKSYVVYLPEGYDGLIFAAEPQPDNYKDYEKNRQMDSIMPEASIMDLYLTDTNGCLFFNICD